MILFVWLISVVISIAILYWVISSAINSSELARDMREIKELLQSQAGVDRKASLPDPSDGEADERCPACGAGVLPTDDVCKSCGLTLIVPGEGNE